MRITLCMFCAACIIMVAGCGSEWVTGAAVGTGVAAGGSSYLNQVKAGLDEKEAILLSQREAAVKKLETTTDELDKVATQNQIKTLEQKIIDMQAQKDAVDIGQQALGTNWADPEAVGGLAGTGVFALLSWYLKRKGDLTGKKYDAIKSGVNAFLAKSDKGASEELYNTIGKSQVASGIKKPMGQ